MDKNIKIINFVMPLREFSAIDTEKWLFHTLIVSLIFSFGLASPLTAWIGCVGILFRWLALSFLAERFEEKVKERGAQVIKTDAQGISFR